ncbi:uncharacterized protein [Phaseolus vulgaris]|uniref:uncharacterized protein n=1 Tax=Phaseolus vulgaris TaxID=3885 RepID=UPI0035CB529C
MVHLGNARHRPGFFMPSSHHGPQGPTCATEERKFNEERRLVVQEDTKKLLSAGHIREIQYPEWLANVVLVKKANGKWRMCVDFTNLNKARPKDSYPLPSIDALVDSASGCKMLSFLDAFSGYNQIKVHPRDECKTTFMTETCCYYYKVMPFGLKNVGATYQRLMDKVLAPMLGRNVQAYIDDMVVTSQERVRHTADLEELFATIAKYRLKLNPEKCVFEVEAGAGPDPETYILRKQGPARAGGEVSIFGEGGPDGGVLGQEAPSLLPKLYGNDGPPHPEGVTKARCRGRMVRWAVELSEFDILYEPRGSIKGQVYADFVAELSPGSTQQEEEVGSQWVLSVDRSSNQQGSGAGVVLEGPNDLLVEQALKFTFKQPKEIGARSLQAKSDSQLVTGQVTGEYQTKDPQMAAYFKGRHQAGTRICRAPSEKRAGESANRILLRGLKRRLEKAKATWVEEVPQDSVAYHTTPQSSTLEMPLSLVYGLDAMIPIEIHESSPRFQSFVAEESNEERRVNLDLLDEAREEARIKAEVVKRRVEHQYSSKVKPR